MKKVTPNHRYDPNKAPKPLPKTNYSKRYEDLKPVIDSGMTVPKLIAQLKNRMPTGEIFRRIRPKKLVELLGLHSYELEEKERLAHEAGDVSNEPEDNSNVPQYHHMHSSIVFNDNRSAQPHEPKRTVDCPFILLDVRDEEEFENCHIQNAENYPKARLSRATGQFTPEILAFKGHPEKMIVVYCDYGQTSGEAAQMFAERGFDNIFLLHGGLAEFAEQFPNLCGPNEPPKPLNQSKSATSQQSAAGRAGKAVKMPAQRKQTRQMQAAAAPPGSKPIWK